jgi:hypothetical protein
MALSAISLRGLSSRAFVDSLSGKKRSLVFSVQSLHVFYPLICTGSFVHQLNRLIKLFSVLQAAFSNSLSPSTDLVANFTPIRPADHVTSNLLVSIPSN